MVDVTISNLSSTSQNVSSALSFRLQDITGQAYNEPFTDIGKSPNGTIHLVSKLRGKIVYNVPKTMHDITFQFQGNGFDGSSVI